jgi:hypothetical protein
MFPGKEESTMDREQIIATIKRRQSEQIDLLSIQDLDGTIPSVIVQEYDDLLIEIGDKKPEEKHFG